MGTRTLNVLSLCTGAGGLELGLRAAGLATRTVCYVEREGFAVAHLVAAMQAGALDEAPVWTDLCTFEGEPWRGSVDLIAAGFPCQPASRAGKRRGRGDHRWLWPDVARIIREVGPGLVYLENVAALVDSGLVADVLGSLASLGYDARWCVLGADAAGAPHRRDRAFVLAWARRGGLVGEGLGDAVRPGRRAQRGRGLGFPPRPGDRDGWEAWLLAGGPEPCIRGGADGVADRVDRVRLCGNGVVPQQAALALALLMP